MNRNWLHFVTREDFAEFLNTGLPEGYYVDDEILEDASSCEKLNKDYGKYFEVTIFEDFVDEFGKAHNAEYNLRFGQFGFLNINFNGRAEPQVSDNIEYISDLNEYTNPGLIYINWIKFVAEQAKGHKNCRGQNYFEDLTQRVERIVQEQKLILQRAAERDLQSFEFPLARGLAKVGSTAPYTQQNELQEAHNKLIQFQLNKQKSVYEENDPNFFS